MSRAPLPLRHPASLAGFLLTALTVAGSVTFHLPDTDTWQHLLVGRAIWQLHHVPTTQLWTWPTFGAPEVNPSWGFRALLWPFWNAGGITGLFVWRWASTLATFALLWLAARRMGARGIGVLAALAACAVLYRLRVQIRPETLAGVWFAAGLWILETRRRGGPDRTAWLIPLAVAWINSHVSYFLFFLLLGSHALDDLLLRDPARRPWRLPLLAALSLAAMLLNPWGWRSLVQPFAYWFQWRHEPIFATIGELGRPRWSEEIWNGALVLGFAIPALAAWRAWRTRREPGGGIDRVQLVLVLVTGAMAFSSMRFLGFLALAAAPFLARDLDAWLASRDWPAWTARPWARLAGLAAVVLGVGLPSWTLPGAQMGVGMDWSEAPVAACDFIARHGIRGRCFNSFEIGGYQLWRFWPERDRLPFMDIHVAGTPEDRAAYPRAHQDPAAWHSLDARHGFQWVMLRHRELPGDQLLDTLDADSTWALVFLDDVAALYVRRPFANPGLERAAYRTMKAGHEGLARLGEVCARDPLIRERATVELERMSAESRACAGAQALLSLIGEMDGRREAAWRHQRRALQLDPFLPEGALRLGDLALAAGHPDEALAAFELARREGSRGAAMDLRLGVASARLGAPGRARAAFRRVLVADPGNAEALDSLRAIEARASGAP